VGCREKGMEERGEEEEDRKGLSPFL